VAAGDVSLEPPHFDNLSGPHTQPTRSTSTCDVSPHLWQQCLVGSEQQVQATGLVVDVDRGHVGQEVIASLGACRFKLAAAAGAVGTGAVSAAAAHRLCSDSHSTQHQTVQKG
jgi:hypothetical protein